MGESNVSPPSAPATRLALFLLDVEGPTPNPDTRTTRESLPRLTCHARGFRFHTPSHKPHHSAQLSSFAHLTYLLATRTASDLQCTATMNETASENSESNEDGYLEALFELYKREAEGNEFELAAEFITQEQLELERSACALLSEAQKADASMIRQLNEQAQEIRCSSIHINQFAKKHYQNKMPWTYIDGGTRIVALLSDCYEVIRSLETNNDSSGDQWVVPSSFERYTRKYLVNESFLAHVLLFSVSQVPVLIYGKSGLITNDGEDPAAMRDIWQTLATPISSVYFDSPGMYLYGRRVARHEGACLFRVRWYGDKKPKGDQLLFLELKTHHEKWVIDKSLKQRVALRERDMATLLARDGAEWDRTFIEDLIHLATPALNGDDLDEAVGLLYQIRRLITEKDLRPCVRTRYLRLALQSKETNACRITIDRDITMTDESSAPLGQWSVQKEESKTVDTVKVPNAVLEVKLTENDNPAFLQELLEIQAIQDGYKFSKYLTGAIKFHFDKVKTMPYWAALPVFDELFCRKVPESDKARVTSSCESRKTPPQCSRKYSNFSLASLRRRSTSSTVSVLPSTQQDLSKLRRVRIEVGLGVLFQYNASIQLLTP